ncbi:hypothetical protein AVEN_225024-1 [Araneus ventricosus]|uniref:Uncharacterized protein n=1 Tax=Araneus ventricosus TaxID=182803 RepID=A0A4Y2GXM8_ARAVE|nr:hypothetical protein AVEN_225024-1 [Araneus ventricosus]
MAYRATSLEKGFSPSELLMGRRINTTLPVANTQLQPYSVNKKVLEAKEERRIEGQKMNYDKHHGVRNLDKLDPGPNVWITDRRIFIQNLSQGTTLMAQDTNTLLPMPIQDVSLWMSSPQSPKTYSERVSSSTEASPDPYVTRSGRTVRPLEKLDL